MSTRRSWADKRAEIMSRSGTPAAYDAARIRFELGEAVRRRREELGLTQAQLAERAGLKQPAVARFEAGGTMPTLPMLERLAAALGLQLTVQTPAVDQGQLSVAEPILRRPAPAPPDPAPDTDPQPQQRTYGIEL